MTAQGNISSRTSHPAGRPVHIDIGALMYLTHPTVDATQTIPIVFCNVDVVRTGLVLNLTQPGGKLTGVSTQSVDVIGTWLGSDRG